MDKKKEQINNTMAIENCSEKITANENLGISPDYNRNAYADSSKMRDAKREAFEQGAVYDPYTNNQLTPNQTTAEELYGNVNERAAETDHAIPLEKIHEKEKKNPFLKDEDIKEIANNPKNLQMTAQHTNRSKNNKTPSEYMQKQKEKGVDIEKQNQRRVKMEERRAKASINAGLATHTAKNMGTEALTGAISAVEASAIPLALTLLGNIVQVCDGKKDAKQATLDISKSVGAVATTGAATKLLKTALKNVDNPTLQTLLEHNLPAQIVSVALLIKDDISGLKTKQISPQTATSNLLTKFSSLIGGKIVRKAATDVLPKILVKFGGANVLGTVAAIYIGECAKNLFDEVVGHGAWEAIKNSSGDCKETAQRMLTAVNTVENNFLVTDQCINSMVSQHQEIENNFTKFDKNKGE